MDRSVRHSAKSCPSKINQTKAGPVAFPNLWGNHISRPKTGLSRKTRRYSFSPKMDSVNHLVMKAMRFTYPKVGVSESGQNIQARFVDNGHATQGA